MKTPTAVGMSSERLAKIDHVIERGISAGGYPGASVVVGRRGAAVWEKGFGKLSWDKSSAAVSPTHHLRSRVADQSRRHHDARSWSSTTRARSVSTIRSRSTSREFSGGDKDRVTLRMLLEHRSGLPAGRDLWRIAHTPEEARAAVIATPLGCEPGRCYEYSDLGADMLGFVVEAASGRAARSVPPGARVVRRSA